MTWPGLLVYGAHLTALPLALIWPRAVLLSVVATAVFRADKLGPAMISTNQIEGIALVLVALRLWKSAEPLPWRPLDRLVFVTYAAILTVRVLQAMVFDVGAYRLAQFSYQEVFRPISYFMAIHLYLRSGGKSQHLVYAACITIVVMIAAILLEWQWFWSWRAFFGTELLAVKGATGSESVSRFGYRLIMGPLGHWVGTGTFLGAYLAFALGAVAHESRRQSLVRAACAVVALGSCLLVGGRAAMLGAVAAAATAVGLALVRPSRQLNWLPSLAPVAALGIGFVASARIRAFVQSGFEYLYFSLFPGTSEAYNLTVRTDIGSVLWTRIGEVPLIGYGWQVARFPEFLPMPVAFNDFEVNFVGHYAYDLGLPVTLLWLATLVIALLAAMWSWLAWRGTDRWPAGAVIIISAALIPILGSNGYFNAQYSQPWLLAVALMTYASAERRRLTRRHKPPARPFVGSLSRVDETAQ